MEDQGHRTQVVWTAQARVYTLGSFLCFALGVLLPAPGLLIAAGIALLAILGDAALILRRIPRLEVHVAPGQVREEGEAVVSLPGDDLRRGHEVLVRLAQGLDLVEGSNTYAAGRRGPAPAFRIRGRVRGPHSIGPLLLREWSPLRLWARDSRIAPAREFHVVPRAELVDRFDLRSRMINPVVGRFQVNRPGQGFDFFTLRNYQVGDTMRSINWKATARSEDLIVNQRQRETFGRLLVLLDARTVAGAGPPGATPLDRSCRAAVTITAQALGERDLVRVFTYGETVEEPKATPAGQLAGLDDHLARCEARGDQRLLEAWRRASSKVKGSGPVVVLSSLEADPDAPVAIREMLARGHSVTVVSPQPSGPSFEGPLALDRRDQRHRAVESARGAGALVVDWKKGQHLWAEAPPLVGGWSP